MQANHARTLASVASFVLLVGLGALPAGAVAPVCPGVGIQCKTISGPGGAEVKDVASLGVGFCHDETGDPIEEDLPFFCGKVVGPSDLGTARFDASVFPVVAGVPNHAVTIWSEWVDPPGGCSEIYCGFRQVVCNDRDLDGVCGSDPTLTNADGGTGGSSGLSALECRLATGCGARNHDQLWEGYSNDGLKPDADGTKDTKETAADPFEAETVACMAPAVDDIWHPDQILVFIGAWVGGTDLNGAGATAGTYDVYLTDGGAVACAPTGITASANCIWERDDLDNTGGSAGADDCGGAGGANVCPTGSVAVIVFVLSHDSDADLSGSTTAAGPCVVGGPITATRAGNFGFDSAAAASPAPYLCSFTWEVILPTDPVEAGGCIVV